MNQRYSDDFLRRLRNEIPRPNVFRVLEWPHQKRDGYSRRPGSPASCRCQT